MKSFLRENPTIAFGLGFPLLLVITFLLVSGIPSLLVAPPQYDLLYATDYYDYQGRIQRIQIDVVEQRVQVIHQDNVQNGRKPHLWRYQSKTGAVQEVPIILPVGLSLTPQKTNNSAKGILNRTVINIPELEELIIDSSSIAPDGYEFNLGQDRYSNNIFRSLFYSSRNHHEGVLTKNGRSIRLPNASGRYYSRHTHFIGWIVSP